MKKLFLALFFLMFCRLGFAASLPDWIKPVLSTELGDWAKEPAVVMHSSHIARFTTADHVIETERIVIRVGTVIGRGAAGFNTAFSPGTEKILNASAWVIGKDGKVQNRFKRGDFTEDFSTYNNVMWDNERILFIDLSRKVELGGYVAFEIEKESINPLYQVSHFISDEFPIVSDTLEVSPPAKVSLQWFSSLASEIVPTPGATPGSLRWSIGRVDKKPDDVPRGYFQSPRGIIARCARPAGSEIDLSSWSSLATAICGVFAPSTKPDDAVRAKAAELTAGKTDRWSRIRALCDFAQRDIRYIQITLDPDYLAGYRPHLAPDVLKKRYGDCKDKAALLVSMLGCIGERAHMLVLTSGDPRAVVEGWPATCWFNHAIVAIPADADTPSHWPVSDAGALGKLVIFDPTDPVSPLGVLSVGDQGGKAMVAAEKDGGLIQLPFDTPAQNASTRNINAKLDPDLLLKVHVNSLLDGSGASESYYERLNVGDVSFGRALEAGLHDSFAHVDNFKWSDTWDAVVSRHTIDRRFSTRSYFKPLGKDRVLIQPGIILTDYALRKINQLDGYVLFSAHSYKQTVSLKLPSGWAVTDLPKPAKAEKSYLSWDITCSCENGILLYSATISKKSAIADFAIYDVIRRESQQLHELLRRPAVLSRINPEVKPKPAE